MLKLNMHYKIRKRTDHPSASPKSVSLWWQGVILLQWLYVLAFHQVNPAAFSLFVSFCFFVVMLPVSFGKRKDLWFLCLCVCARAHVHACVRACMRACAWVCSSISICVVSWSLQAAVFSNSAVVLCKTVIYFSQKTFYFQFPFKKKGKITQ